MAFENRFIPGCACCFKCDNCNNSAGFTYCGCGACNGDGPQYFDVPNPFKAGTDRGPGATIRLVLGKLVSRPLNAVGWPDYSAAACTWVGGSLLISDGADTGYYFLELTIASGSWELKTLYVNLPYAGFSDVLGVVLRWTAVDTPTTTLDCTCQGKFKLDTGVSLTSIPAHVIVNRTFCVTPQAGGCYCGGCSTVLPPNTTPCKVCKISWTTSITADNPPECNIAASLTLGCAGSSNSCLWVGRYRDNCIRVDFNFSGSQNKGYVSFTCHDWYVTAVYTGDFDGTCDVGQVVTLTFESMQTSHCSSVLNRLAYDTTIPGFVTVFSPPDFIPPPSITLTAIKTCGAVINLFGPDVCDPVMACSDATCMELTWPGGSNTDLDVAGIDQPYTLRIANGFRQTGYYGSYSGFGMSANWTSKAEIATVQLTTNCFTPPILDHDWEASTNIQVRVYDMNCYGMPAFAMVSGGKYYRIRGPSGEPQAIGSNSFTAVYIAAADDLCSNNFTFAKMLQSSKSTGGVMPDSSVPGSISLSPITGSYGPVYSILGVPHGSCADYIGDYTVAVPVDFILTMNPYGFYGCPPIPATTWTIPGSTVTISLKAMDRSATNGSTGFVVTGGFWTNQRLCDYHLINGYQYVNQGYATCPDDYLPGYNVGVAPPGTDESVVGELQVQLFENAGTGILLHVYGIYVKRWNSGWSFMDLTFGSTYRSTDWIDGVGGTFYPSVNLNSTYCRCLGDSVSIPPSIVVTAS